MTCIVRSPSGLLRVACCNFDRDVAAIALANDSMGDYKLKSSTDYEVRVMLGGKPTDRFVRESRGTVRQQGGIVALTSRTR